MRVWKARSIDRHCCERGDAVGDGTPREEPMRMWSTSVGCGCGGRSASGVLCRSAKAQERILGLALRSVRVAVRVKTL